MAELGFSLQHILVGNPDLLFQGVERRVAKNLPPLTAQDAIAGLRRLPAVGRRLPIALRHGRHRTLVSGTFHAAGTGERQRGEGNRKMQTNVLGDELEHV